MLKTTANAEGLDKSVLESFRQAMAKDSAQFFLDDPGGPFFGFDRPGVHKSERQIRSCWHRRSSRYIREDRMRFTNIIINEVNKDLLDFLRS